MKNLEKLYEEISVELFKYIMNLSGNKAIAEDIVQETFCKALEHMTTNEKELNISWFYTVSRNLYFNYVKKYNNRFSSMDNLNTKEDVDNNVEKIMIERLDADEIKEKLKELPPNYRKVIILREYKELSYEEIAMVMNCSLSKVKITLFRARKKFKKLYENNDK